MSAPIRRKQLDQSDWIAAAIAAFTADGVDAVRVLSLAATLGVSRGSFYWHFKSRGELLDAVIAHWRRNTEALVTASRAPVAGFIDRMEMWNACWLDQSRYDPMLDIAMRDWARRDARIFAMVRDADEERLDAIAEAFKQNGETISMARIRANVMYYMQMGYYMISEQEPFEQRIARVADYYNAFTGAAMPPERAEAMIVKLRKGAMK